MLNRNVVGRRFRGRLPVDPTRAPSGGRQDLGVVARGSQHDAERSGRSGISLEEDLTVGVVVVPFGAPLGQRRAARGLRNRIGDLPLRAVERRRVRGVDEPEHREERERRAARDSSPPRFASHRSCGAQHEHTEEWDQGQHVPVIGDEPEGGGKPIDQAVADGICTDGEPGAGLAGSPGRMTIRASRCSTGSVSSTASGLVGIR
jgi:hypothetical protein